MEDDIRARRAEERQKKLRKIWKIARPVLVIILSLTIALGGVYLVGKALYEKFLLPIDAKDATPIEITIPSGYGASYIGKVLYEEGLINNKAVFKVYVDFMGKSSSLRSGTYILSKNMDIAQMVDIMCTGNPPRKTIDLRVTEGTDVKMIGEQLVQLGVLESPEEFYELCKTGEEFMDFTFIAAIEDDPSEARKYKLEGYLFPDTYEIYSDSSPDVIINKMLVKFLEVFNVGYSERAEELGLTMDEVVTLASLVEREAKTTSPYGRDKEHCGSPIRIAEMLATIEGSAYIERVAVNNSPNIVKAKRAIKKAFETQLEGKGFSLVEVLSNCPTNWGMNPSESMEWLEQNMIPYYPLGVKKEV